MIQSGDAGSNISGGHLDAAPLAAWPSSASVTIHVGASTAAGYSATLPNTATATASNNSPGSVTASATDTVLAPHLTITKVGNGTVNSTDTVAFTITVSNTGAGTAYNVSVSDPLPDAAHLTWMIQVGPRQRMCGGILGDAIGSVASGASVTIHVSAPTAAGYSATLPNTATATSTNNSPGSVTASATDTVLAPHLTITKVGDPALVQLHRLTVHFTITVSNTAGRGGLQASTLSDPLPDSAHLNWMMPDAGDPMASAVGP